MHTIFFPRNDYPNNVEICSHRLGKKMTYTEQTDGLQIGISYLPFMTLAKARNIKVGCFVGLSNPVTDTSADDVRNDYENGKIWLDAYSLAPNIQTKIINAEVITQEEWNTAYNTYLLPNFHDFTGKKPVALSYSYGNQTFKNYITQFLGARNSGYNGDTDYGVGKGSPNNIPYSFNDYKSKQSTTRWYDEAKTNGNDFNGQLAIQSALIDATMLNSGWLNNFTHWHNYWQDGNEEWAETYLDLLASKNANNEIYFAGYGEAVAYLVYRQLISKVVMYSPKNNHQDTLIIRLESTNALNVDVDLLQVPISVKFSTAGTPLEDQTIKSDCNLISLGSNQYIIEIPYAEYPKAVIEKVNI